MDCFRDNNNLLEVDNTLTCSKDEASLITPASASNPPKVTKVNIPTPTTSSTGFNTPLLGIDSPLEANQQMLADAIKSVQENTLDVLDYLNESLIEQRSSLENKLTALAGQVQKVNSCNVQKQIGKSNQSIYSILL
ncbi:hypothetical protein PIROE2DRAFT_2168 [Piromyces sp. E2]|nr:hypothetical protein PIROE2DRAFT_2168 [Piromyces sp. E2]|eukprot:OUM69750.1 hypothetical protein PIROE2DRAFT_2168 [Piromyces sp. E2]